MSIQEQFVEVLNEHDIGSRPNRAGYSERMWVACRCQWESVLER